MTSIENRQPKRGWQDRSRTHHLAFGAIEEMAQQRGMEDRADKWRMYGHMAQPLTRPDSQDRLRGNESELAAGVGVMSRFITKFDGMQNLDPESKKLWGNGREFFTASCEVLFPDAIVEMRMADVVMTRAVGHLDAAPKSDRLKQCAQRVKVMLEAIREMGGIRKGLADDPTRLMGILTDARDDAAEALRSYLMEDVDVDSAGDVSSVLEGVYQLDLLVQIATEEQKKAEALARSRQVPVHETAAPRPPEVIISPEEQRVADAYTRLTAEQGARAQQLNAEGTKSTVPAVAIFRALEKLFPETRKRTKETAALFRDIHQRISGDPRMPRLQELFGDPATKGENEAFLLSSSILNDAATAALQARPGLDAALQEAQTGESERQDREINKLFPGTGRVRIDLVSRRMITTVYQEMRNAGGL